MLYSLNMNYLAWVQTQNIPIDDVQLLQGQNQGSLSNKITLSGRWRWSIRQLIQLFLINNTHNGKGVAILPTVCSSTF